MRGICQILQEKRRAITSGVVVAFAAGLIFPTLAPGAGEPFVYPTKGQSKEEMEKEKYSCYQWAKEQTGFDPMQAPSPSAAAPYKSKSSPLRGAAGGAALGAAVGAIAGDAGTGAAIGAASGGIIGGARRRQSQQEQEAYVKQQSSEYGDRRSEYDRAWGACLEGKGYAVK